MTVSAAQPPGTVLGWVHAQKETFGCSDRICAYLWSNLRITSGMLITVWELWPRSIFIFGWHWCKSHFSHVMRQRQRLCLWRLVPDWACSPRPLQVRSKVC